MRKIVVFSLLLIFLISVNVLAKGTGKKNNKPAVKSTEGIEVTESDAKKVSKAKTPEDKEAKKRLKNRKKVMRNLTKIERYEHKKHLRNRDKEFLEHRLNLKKQKLEELGESSEKEDSVETDKSENMTDENTQTTEQNEETKTNNVTDDDKKGEN